MVTQSLTQQEGLRCVIPAGWRRVDHERLFELLEQRVVDAELDPAPLAAARGALQDDRPHLGRGQDPCR